MKKQAIMLLEEEEAMLSTAAYLQLQIMKKEKPARKKKSIRKKSWLQRRVLYGQYEKLVAELRGEDTKSFRNYIVSRSPSVKWRPVRTEPSIYKYRRYWSRDSENESYTPWHNRGISVAYPLHIRSFSMVNRELNFSYGKSRKG